MGTTFEVWIWVQTDLVANYKYEQVYAGESMLTALQVARKHKKNGIGCVKIYWR